MIYLKFKQAKSTEIKRSAQVVRTLTIGRSPLADIRIEDDVDISRFHATVVPLPDGRLMVSDSYSLHGVLVDAGKQKRKLVPVKGGEFGSGPIAILAVGEKFYIGSYVAEVCYEEVLGEPTLHEISYKSESMKEAEEEDQTGEIKIAEVEDDLNGETTIIDPELRRRWRR